MSFEGLIFGKLRNIVRIAVFNKIFIFCGIATNSFPYFILTKTHYLEKKNKQFRSQFGELSDACCGLCGRQGVESPGSHEPGNFTIARVLFLW